MEITNIKIKDVEIIENVRVEIKDEKIQELMQSIKQHGLLQPIGVVGNQDKYILIYGHRRLTACQKLGWVDIPAEIKDDVELKELLLLNLTENMQRKDNTPSEIGRICIRLRDEFGCTNQEIAVRLGVNEHRVRSSIDIYNGIPDKYRKTVGFMKSSGAKRNGKIPASVAHKVISLKKARNLSNSTCERILNEVKFESLSVGQLDILTEMLHNGMTTVQSLDKLKDYKIYRVDVVAKRDEIDDLLNKNKLTSSIEMFKKIIYGEIDPIQKPDFVSVSRKKK